MSQAITQKLTQQEKAQVEALVQATSYRSARFIAVVAFVFGVGLFINVRVGVRLSVTELLTPFIFLALSSGLSKLLSFSVIRNSIFFLVLHMIGVACSDSIGDVPFPDFMRGMAKPVFILALLINIGLILVNGTRFIVPLWLGLVCGAGLHLAFNAAGDPYDYSVSTLKYAFFVFRIAPLLTFACSFASFFLFKYNKPLAIGVLVVGMVVSVLFGTRSSAFSWLIAIACMAYASRWSPPNPYEILHPGRKLFFAALSLMALSLTSYYCYRYVALNGYLGDSLKQKANRKELENDFGWGPIGLIVNGRAETVGSVLMILDSPILGHGTTSQSGAYFMEAFRLAGIAKVSENDIPGIVYGRVTGGHSILLAAWASNGILTVPFWTYLLIRILRLGTLLVLAKDRYIGLFGLLLAIMVWDIIFSPLSVLMRSCVPLVLCFSAFYIPELEAAYARLLRPARPLSPPGVPNPNFPPPRGFQPALRATGRTH